MASPSWRAAMMTALAVLSPTVAAAQATCIDGSGAMCLDAIGGGVDDVFQTSDGRFAPELSFATYIRGVNGSCAVGQTTNPRIDSAYTCFGGAGAGVSDGAGRCTFTEHARAAEAADSLDWLWTQVQRTRDDCTFVADGEPGNYIPWRGRIYDLGGEANRVVLFPITDHGPYPCEAFEYTVWLTNNPDSLEIAPEGAPDATKWNRALMMRAFNHGWTRNPNATGAAERDRVDLDTWLRDASTGDAIADSTVTVWALPCGITFRYASIQAGNDGNPVDACVFHSGDDELDAVAGLNEDDTAICVDADGDGHRDADCGGSDCDDSDPDVHPGAFEPCNADRDLDCNPAEPCPEDTVCDEPSGLCVPSCFEGGCAEGFDCVGGRCVDTACVALPEPCPDGTLCRAGACVDPCEGAVCPTGERCVGGTCIDPCEGVICPPNQVCIARDPDALTLCGPACSCSELAVPLCPEDRACDDREGSPTSGECVDPGCETAVCGPGEVCEGGACRDGCEGVTCPLFHVCTAGECVTDRCARVRCPAGESCHDGECFTACELTTCEEGFLCRDGACIPDRCFGVVCLETERCVEGTCVPSGPQDAGTDSDGGGLGADAGPGGPGSKGGCGCNVPGAGAAALPPLLVLVAWLIFRRRR